MKFILTSTQADELPILTTTHSRFNGEAAVIPSGVVGLLLMDTTYLGALDTTPVSRVVKHGYWQVSVLRMALPHESLGWMKRQTIRIYMRRLVARFISS
jgi:hypothetical protein